MNPFIRPKQTSPLFVVALFLACFGLVPAPNAFGVVPAPDGGYPGGNTAEGQTALLSLTTGGFNTAVGYLSLRSNTTAPFNTAVGAGTLPANTGDSNTATGAGALLHNTTGTENTANGAFALYYNTTGGLNTAIGRSALAFNSTGGLNTAFGFGAGGVVTTASNVICIGANVGGANVSNSCFIGNIRDATTAQNDAIPVLIDSAGQLGTTSSSARFKKDIKPMNKISEAILALNPVTFRYKVHKDSTPQFGLVAEEVAKVNRDLVIYGADGKPYTVRYDAVNAMLLNEFLKEHKKVEEQQATIAELKSAVAQEQRRLAQQEEHIAALALSLEEVRTQIATNKPVPQLIASDR